MHIHSLRPIAMMFAVGLVMIHLINRRLREKRAKRLADARKSSFGAKRGTRQKGATTHRPLEEK